MFSCIWYPLYLVPTARSAAYCRDRNGGAEEAKAMKDCFGSTVVTVTAALFMGTSGACTADNGVNELTVDQQTDPASSAAAPAQTTVFHLAATTCGTWNAAGVHTVGSYQIGYSAQLPTKQAAYFIFDLTPVRGRVVTANNITIPGTTDFHITGDWPNHPAGTPAVQFKAGMTPQNVAANSVNQITTGNNDVSLYNNAIREQDLGYGWVPDGLHAGKAFDAFHFNPGRLQALVDTGGLIAFWAVDRADINAGSENYIWGHSTCSAGIVMNVTAN
jgi:hypothetical protein